MGKVLFFLLLLTAGTGICRSQPQEQIIRGKVTDNETGKPLTGANVIILNAVPPYGVLTDDNGQFSLTSSYGRISLRISYVGYEDLELANILVTAGNEVQLDVSLREKIFRTGEVIITGTNNNSSPVSRISPISSYRIRTEDAMRFAGGFYDPSRIVNSYAGIVTSNSDYSNEIIIRGNSSRGLLWRLEGIEIPNPNHFSSGNGGSGGAFSAITSNVIDNFEFLTGAFPAEYGNAFSGVMDLNLRKGNSSVNEFAFQTGMIGAECSAEGPLPLSKGGSYLLNARYTNFRVLSGLGLIDLGQTNFPPRTHDLVFNLDIPAGKTGNFNIFGYYGKSVLGKKAVRDTASWKNLADRWEESEMQSSLVIGLKNVLTIHGSGSYIRSVIALTSYTNRFYEGYLDSSFVRTDDYFYRFRYPSLRSSILFNHKINAANSLRAGITFSYMAGNMKEYRINDDYLYDTLVVPRGNEVLLQEFFQWKSRPFANFEISTGVHLVHFSIGSQTLAEPRTTIRWKCLPGLAFNAGAGLHSRTEALSVYYSNIRNASGLRSPENKDLGLARAFHLIAGVEVPVKKDILVRAEGYYQDLFRIPVSTNPASRYSAINSSEGLSNEKLEDTGKGYNRGIELTLEKAFTRNYYFLITGSLFKSRYKAGGGGWYDTYYNTGHVFNILAGKEFPFGKANRNIIGINSRLSKRGGYRFTPVDEERSLKAGRIISDRNNTYGASLPDYLRTDAGINFRRNQGKYSWIVMLDIQNVTNRKNVFRKKFLIENGNIRSYDTESLGIVPVFNFRLEF